MFVKSVCVLYKMGGNYHKQSSVTGGNCAKRSRIERVVSFILIRELQIY